MYVCVLVSGLGANHFRSISALWHHTLEQKTPRHPRVSRPEGEQHPWQGDGHHDEDWQLWHQHAGRHPSVPHGALCRPCL